MMEDYKHLVEGVSLSAEDVGTLEMWNWAVEELSSRESVSVFALQYGKGSFFRMSKRNIVGPCLRAIDAFYADNGIENGRFTSDWNESVFNTKVFGLGRNIKSATDDARSRFSGLMENLKADGVVKQDYDTEWVFRGCFGDFIWKVSEQLIKRTQNMGKLYKEGLFSKYRITALDDADDLTLRDFRSDRYNEYDVEAMLILAGLYDGEEGTPYREIEVTDVRSVEITESDVTINASIVELYDKVKSIVYEDVNRPLKESKTALEEYAKQCTKEEKRSLPYLYACAVLQWQSQNELMQSNNN